MTVAMEVVEVALRSLEKVFPERVVRYPALGEEFTLMEFFVLALCPFVFHQVFFWAYSLLLLAFADGPLMGKKKNTTETSWTRSVKLQPKEVVSWSDVFKCARVVLRNQVFLMLPFSLLQAPYLRRSSPALAQFAKDPSCLFGATTSSAVLEWPYWYEVLAQLVFCFFIEEIGFYYSHRLLHTPSLYKKIHKQHHEFRAPIGMAAEYAHPFEFAVSNLLPITSPPMTLSLLLGPQLGGFHPLTLVLWYTVNIYGTISHHCGYRFPWLLGGLDPTFHDDHHRVFNANYGLNGLCDWIHSTKAKAVETQEAKKAQ